MSDTKFIISNYSVNVGKSSNEYSKCKRDQSARVTRKMLVVHPAVRVCASKHVIKMSTYCDGTRRNPLLGFSTIYIVTYGVCMSFYGLFP